MNSMMRTKVKSPAISFLILIVLSFIASYGDVVLNTVFALISTKNNFSLLSRFGINLIQIIISSLVIYYLINVLYVKISLLEIKAKVKFYEVLSSRWPVAIIIIPIILNNHFNLIEKSFVYVIFFTGCLLFYFYYQSKNYLNLISTEMGNVVHKKNILYLTSLIVVDLLLIKTIQTLQQLLNF